MISKSESAATGGVRGRRPRRLLLQTGGAVLLSALFYALLILAPSPFPAGFAFSGQSIGRWALYVCLLLTCWSLAGLSVDWWRAIRRQRCIAGTSIPPGASLASAEGVREVTGIARAAAARYGDGLLAGRIEQAIARFQSSHSAVSAAEELAAADDAALVELEAAHAPQRLFLYAIPILGFAGTVMGIRQILERAALAPSFAPQQLDAIRAALSGITASLAGSFNTALLAMLLSLVVMVALTWVMEKEKSLLLDIDDFCRTRLLPLMQAAETPPASASANASAGAGQLAIEQLRNELSGAWSHHFELANRYLEQEQARSLDLAKWFDELRTLLSARQENLATLQHAGQAEALAPQPTVQVNGHSLGGPSASAAHVEELGAALEDLRDGIYEMDSFLQRFAARLRSQTQEPLQVQVK